MAFNVTLQTGAARATINPASPTPTTGGATTTGPERSGGSRESFERTSGTRRQGLEMGGTQPTHHAMLIPKSQFQQHAPKGAANDNPVNHGTPEEKAQGLHVDEHGWVTLPPGSTLTIPPKT